jgi:hypothetical protein
MGVAYEGPEKATRGEGEWEPIKIPQRNFAYVPKLTQRASLLTRSRLLSYRQATSLRTGLGNLESQQKHESMLARTRTRLCRQKLDQKSVQVLTGISLNTLWACLENHHVRAIRTKKTRAFSSGSSRT